MRLSLQKKVTVTVELDGNKFELDLADAQWLRDALDRQLSDDHEWDEDR